MPQFDLFSIFVQMFYVSIAFVIIYICFEYYFLSNVSRILKARQKSIVLGDNLFSNTNNTISNKPLYTSIVTKL